MTCARSGIRTRIKDCQTLRKLLREICNITNLSFYFLIKCSKKYVCFVDNTGRGGGYPFYEILKKEGKNEKINRLIVFSNCPVWVV